MKQGPILRWTLMLALSAVLTLRLWVIVTTAEGYTLTGDEGKYDCYARSIVQRGQFANCSGWLRAWAPPLYPAVLALIYAVAGLGNYTAARVAQIVLELCTLLFIWRTARLAGVSVWKPAAGVLGYVFYPTMWLTLGSVRLETEPLFMLLFWAALYLLARNYPHTARSSLLIGIILGLATLTRPTTFLFPIALVILVGMDSMSEEWDWGRRIARCWLPIAGGLLLTTVPWIVRNAVVVGVANLTTHSASTIHAGTYLPSDGYGLVWKSVDDPELAWLRSQGDERVLYEGLMREAMENIREGGNESLLLAAKQMTRVWLGLPMQGVTWRRYGSAVATLVLLVSALVAAGLTWRQDVEPVHRYVALLFLCVFVYFTVSHALMPSTPRFGTPVLPFVFIYCGDLLPTVIRRVGFVSMSDRYAERL